jgi:CSLREA domain-containing protein
MTSASGALVALGGLGPVTPALAATITPTVLTDDNTVNGNCTLREAVRAANENTIVDTCAAGSFGADTITLGAGTYTLSVGPAGDDAAATGDLDITESVTITGAGSSATAIDGAGIDRVFEVDPLSAAAAVTAELAGLTVRGGDAGTDDGGGLRTQDGLVLTSVVVTANDGDDGGGIELIGDPALTMTGTAVTANTSLDDGGGIDNGTGIVTMTDSTVSGNTAGGPGGAIDNVAGVLTITDSTVSGNVTTGTDSRGGGIENRIGATLVMINSTVSGNSAQMDGGGIHQPPLDSSSTTLTNVTVTGNTADSDSGGVAGDGGGVSIGSGTFTVQNTIVAGNGDPTSDPDCAGTLTSGGYNIIGVVSAGCTLTPSTGDQTGVDPKLGPLADRGGPTQTHALLEGSPAIDNGNPAPPGSGGVACSANDQRGALRKTCDVGAYELVKCGGATVNRVGTDGDDTLKGTGGKDGLLGLGGKDLLAGKAGKDGLCGGTGKDILRGGGGKDRLKGEAGKDTCVGGGGTDKAVTCEKEKGIP